MTNQYGGSWATTVISAVLLGSLGAMSGCQSLGTVMTQVDMEMVVQTEGHDAPPAGATYPASVMYAVKRSPRSKIPFDHPAYRDELLEWRIQVPLHRISFYIKSNAAHPLLLRWDQSTWRSSEHPSPIPLRVYRFSTGYVGSAQVLIDISADAPAVLPVALEIETGKAALPVNLQPDWKPLFSKGYIFGIETVEQGYGFIDDGIGRWLELELPVEMNEERWVYRIRLTVRDIAQWTSYH